MRTIPLALCSLLLCAPLAARGADRSRDTDPLAREIAQREASGYSVVDKASARKGKDRLAAVLYRKGEGQSYQLRAYKVGAGKASLLLYEPSYGARMVLSSPHAGGDIPDLLGDGSRILAYEATLPGPAGSAYSKLVVLQYLRGKIQRVGELPYARFQDVDGDGRPEIVEQSRPLGKFFQLECESFFSQAQSAFRVRVYELTAGPGKAAFRDVSSKHHDFFSKRIRDGEAKLAELDPRATKDYGGYLGQALSVYFDYAATGRGREGWEKFRSFFKPRPGDPSQVAACLKQMEGTLRQKLEIPEDW